MGLRFLGCLSAVLVGVAEAVGGAPGPLAVPSSPLPPAATIGVISTAAPPVPGPPTTERNSPAEVTPPAEKPAPIVLDAVMVSPEAASPDPLATGPQIPLHQPCPNPVALTFDVDYLLWFFLREQVPTALASNLPESNLGLGRLAVPRPATPELPFGERPLSGVRLTVGYWLDELDPGIFDTPCFRCMGVEARAMFFGGRSIFFANDTDPALTRPFFDLNNRRESAFLVAFPGVATGSLFGSATIDAWGLEANARANVYSNGPGAFLRVDVLAGYRYFDFRSRLRLNSQSIFAANLDPVPQLAGFAGNRLDVTDRFSTDNSYHGAQVGASVEFFEDAPLVAGASGKFAVGSNYETLEISGTQVRTFPGGQRVVTPAGLYALPSNSGRFSRGRMALLGEGNLYLRATLSKHFSLTLGYTILGLDRVIRPVSQIDRVLDTSQIPNFPGTAGAPTGLGRPKPLFSEENLITQGLTISVSCSW